jgi:hypothetical protein
MTQKKMHILLSIVERNGCVQSLLKQGLNYRQISELTNTAILEGLIIYEDNAVMLSDSGKKRLVELRQLLKKIDKDQWIEKEKSSIIPKIERDFIFLPNQNELFF